MQSPRRLVALVGAGLALVASARAGESTAPEPNLPRPGVVAAAEVTGEVNMIAGVQRKRVNATDRLRVGGTVVTGRRSMVALQFSNGASVRLGPDSELEVEEFGQVPVSDSVKFAELKQEPTLSRTRLRLVRGDVTLVVKPLKVSRGSSFVLALPAGALRTGDGTIRVWVEMSDFGLGVARVELQSGAGEFEPVGGRFAPLTTGRAVTLAIEQDKATGAVKLVEMPKESAAPTGKK